MVNKKILKDYLKELNRKQYEGIPLSTIEKGKNIPLIERFNSLIKIDSITEEVNIGFKVLQELLKEEDIKTTGYKEAENDHPEIIKNFENENCKIEAKVNLSYYLEFSKINISIKFKEEKQILLINENFLGYASELKIDFNIYKMTNELRKSFLLTMKSDGYYNIFKENTEFQKENYYQRADSDFPQIMKLFNQNMSLLNENILNLYLKKTFGKEVTYIGKKSKLKLLMYKDLLREKEHLKYKYNEDITFNNYKNFIEILELKEDNTLKNNPLIIFYNTIREEMEENKLKTKLKV